MRTIFDEELCVGNGKFDTQKNLGGKYQSLSVLKILAFDPVSLPKDSAPWCLASNYLESDARTHEVQRQKGQFCILVADIDTGNHSLSAIEGCVKELAFDIAHRIYSSRSSVTENKKWRIIIPLLNPLSFNEWELLQQSLNDHLESCVITPDRALERSAQPIYLPNTSEGSHYESVLGGNLELGWHEHDDSKIYQLVNLRKQQNLKHEEAKKEALQIREKKSQLRQPGGDPSIIERFNKAYSIEQLLYEYGYDNKSGTDDWRSPLQTTASYATRNYGDYWVSVSGSDADAGLGIRGGSGFCSGDAFALFTFYEHGGDHIRAVKELK